MPNSCIIWDIHCVMMCRSCIPCIVKSREICIKISRNAPENTDTDVPSMGPNGLARDRDLHWRYADVHVLSASFIKCRNIGLSYTLPQEWVRTLKLKNVNVRAQVNNPFYWAKNKEGIDPEAFNANEGTRAQEQVTTYVFGLNINF